jgi:GNAT superfamily N-acetyltransferase
MMHPGDVNSIGHTVPPQEACTHNADATALATLVLPPRTPPIGIEAIVDLRDLLNRDLPRAMTLLDQGFAIYCACFPDPSERESKETLLEYLQDPDLNWRMFLALDTDGVVIAGRSMNIMEAIINGEPVQFAWGEHLYVSTDPAYRGQKIGSSLVRETNSVMRGFNVGLVFSEQNDPHLMTQEEIEVDMRSGISPEERLQFWAKQGYRAFNAPYAQPPLGDGDPVLYLKLCCYIADTSLIPESVGFTGTSIDKDAYLSLVRHFHGTFVEDMNTDPTSAYLKTLIDGGPQEISLIPVETPRTFTQDRIDITP